MFCHFSHVQDVSSLPSQCSTASLLSDADQSSQMQPVSKVTETILRIKRRLEENQSLQAAVTVKITVVA